MVDYNDDVIQYNEPRRRVNFSTSVKGIVTWDFTVETIPGSGLTMDDLLADADRLRAACEARCPAVPEL